MAASKRLDVGTTEVALAITALQTNVVFKNIGAMTLFIGATGVTPATGMPVRPGEGRTLTGLFAADPDAWYAIAPYGTGRMAVMTF